MILEHEGACTRLEDAARQEIAARGGSRAHWALASAFASAGRPVEMVHEELRESWETAPEHVRPMLMLSDELRLDALGGNFDAAARRARAMNGALAEGPMAAHYGRFLSTFILFLEEFGRREEAAAIAEAFLARSGAEERYFPPEDSRIADDATPIALAVLLRDGRISRPDFEARLAAWARAWESKVHADFRGYIWLHGYAATVETPEDARAALAALPAYEPLPAYYPGTIVEAAAGLTFLLGGRVDEATALLSRPTKSCRALAFPLEHTRAHEWLGRALEAKGDKKGACSAYMVVLDRWGNAKPRSVTTEKAKIRADEIGCDSQVKPTAGPSH
jgi:serine/threonine-protein kinase